jgi:hypothetical protein
VSVQFLLTFGDIHPAMGISGVRHHPHVEFLQHHPQVREVRYQFPQMERQLLLQRKYRMKQTMKDELVLEIASKVLFGLLYFCNRILDASDYHLLFGACMQVLPLAPLR